MPFTFSHPALVLPFGLICQRYFSLTALIIGSMTPDFEYFLRLKVRSDYSHTLLGVFWFDLPIGIILCFVFHLVIKNSLFRNLPSFLQIRFNNFLDFDFMDYFSNNFSLVIFSLLLGAFSHLFWDGFTHYNGFFVELFPILQTKTIFYSIPIFKILQHLSTFLGGICIALWVYKLPQNSIFIYPVSVKYWLCVLSSFVFLFSIRLFLMYYFQEDFHIGNFVVSGISLLLLSLVLTGVVETFYYKKNYS